MTPVIAFDVILTCNSDAFQPDPAPELARIMREIASKLENGQELPARILDVNGNHIGGVCVLEAD